MKRLITSLIALCSLAVVSAQIPLAGGSLTGSVESNSILYLDDATLGDKQIPFGSNDYVKVLYTNGRWSAGLQGDAYLPALIGYDDIRNAGAMDPAFALSQLFLNYRGNNFEVTAGDFFEQFGSGLVFRSFEDRQLGMNNATQGLRFTMNAGDNLTLKAFAGRPRLAVLGHAGSWVGGLDLAYNLANQLNWQNVSLALEGSYVARYEDLHKEGSEVFGENIFEMAGMTTPLIHLYSGRASFNWNSLSISGEYVGKSKDLSEAVDFEAHNGMALRGDVAYSHGTFNIVAQGRLLKNMGTRMTLYDTSLGNALNYIPAMTRQHTYLLANLTPHQVNTHSELAAQADAYYRIRDSRRTYWQFHSNFAIARNQEFGNLTWMDFNIDVERKWNKSWKSVFLYTMQKHNPNKGFVDMIFTSHTFVADVTYKVNNETSLRGELQYLYSNDYEGDWMAALVELQLPNSLTIYVSDMYNHQRIDTFNEKVNYYSIGASYTMGRSRMQLSYGRNRAGMICSGGVCRYTPAYTGFNLLLTTSF